MADPKNKWDQPAAPPPPMFFGKKERDLVKQVNDELSERIIGQPIAYYPISLEESNFNETYGEAIEKVSLPPIRIYAYVEVENEQTNETFGYDYQTKLTVNFSERRITEDQNVYVRVGDFVQYGQFFYEIVRTYNDTRYYFGQVEHKFQISAECVRARDGAFRVMPSIDRPGTTKALANADSSSPAPRPAPYPPVAASYITVSREERLPNERVLVGGTGITLTDTGAGGTLTIANVANAAVGAVGAIQVSLGDASGSFYGDSTFLYLTASDTLSLTGYVTASGHVSSSTFFGTSVSSSNFNLLPTSGSIAGRGSFLALDTQNNIIITSSLGSGEGDGIFTTINGTQAYVTSSLAIGGTTAPDHRISVSGSVSASVNVSASAFYGSGANLTSLPAGGLITAINATQAYLTSSLALGGTSAPDHALSISGSVSASINVSASAFYGSGANLTGVTASAVEVADGPLGSMQFRVNTPVSGEISGSSAVLYDTSSTRLTVAAGLIHNRTAISTTHTASVSEYILGVTAVPTEILFDATLFTAGQVLVVKDESGVASASNTILLNASASQAIDGAGDVSIESPYGSLLLYSNGFNWFIY
jgi:hypothetical protein